MNHITIYTDGAYSSSRKQGGVGVVFVKNDSVVGTISKMFQNVTNNKMELAAVIMALKNVLKNKWEDVTIVTDSQYVIGCATQGWKRKKNERLWYRFDLLKQELDSKKININFSWVHGHNGDKYNEIADKLAVEASQELNLKF